jgi:hypothetical protein
MVLPTKSKISIIPIWKTFIALHKYGCANFVSNPYSKVYKGFMIVFIFILFSQPKITHGVFEVHNFYESKGEQDFA